MLAIKAQASIEIAASVESIKSILVNFRTWPVWSPWLCLEPDAQVEYRGTKGQVDHGYDWNGRKVGAGGMTLTHISDTEVGCDLVFLKPFKSIASVRFEFQKIDADQTLVTWYMNSRLPIFLFFMTGTMSGMIRSDYRRGLAMLKDYVEDGQVPSHSAVEGIVELDAVDYVGCSATTPLSGISDSMKTSFGQLYSGLNAGSFVSSGKPFCFYRRMDYKRDTCQYTSAVPVAGRSELPALLVAGRRPACKALKVVHTGAYRHLGNAWSMLMSEARHGQLKVLKSISPFESYFDDPETIPAAQLVTELYLPLRS